MACETTGGPVTHTELALPWRSQFTVNSQSQEVTSYEEGIYTHKIAVSSSGSGLGSYYVYFRNAASRNSSSLSMRGNAHS